MCEDRFNVLVVFLMTFLFYSCQSFGQKNSECLNAAVLHKEIDTLRKNSGLRLTRSLPELALMARQRSEVMARKGEVGHVNAEENLLQQLARQKIYRSRAGENIQRYQTNSRARDVMRVWLDGNREKWNLMNPEYASHGIGQTRSGAFCYVVLLLTD